MHIVLHQPEIPANTGNIGRTCVATGTSLHLIEPLGFRLDEKAIKRAGMDYWSKLDLHRYMNYEEFKSKLHSGDSELAFRNHKIYDQIFEEFDKIFSYKEKLKLPGQLF